LRFAMNHRRGVGISQSSTPLSNAGERKFLNGNILKGVGILSTTIHGKTKMARNKSRNEKFVARRQGRWE